MHDDFEFFSRRYEQETDLATSAAAPEAVLAHYTLSLLYKERIASLSGFEPSERNAARAKLSIRI